MPVVIPNPPIGDCIEGSVVLLAGICNAEGGFDLSWVSAGDVVGGGIPEGRSIPPVGEKRAETEPPKKEPS